MLLTELLTAVYNLQALGAWLFKKEDWDGLSRSEEGSLWVGGGLLQVCLLLPPLISAILAFSHHLLILPGFHFNTLHVGLRLSHSWIDWPGVKA